MGMAKSLTGPVATWALLLVLTGLSYLSWLDADWADPRLFGSAVIVIAAAKAWLIGWQFMELREAIWPLRLIYSLWVTIVAGMLLAMFGLSP